MKQRIILAACSLCLALTIVLMSYAPPRAVTQAIGDPLDGPLLHGFAPAAFENGVLMRRVDGAGSIHLPLPDGRGAHHVTLSLRADRHATPLHITANNATTSLVATPTLRTYRLLLPAQSERHLDLQLVASAPVALDHVVVMGRGGASPWLDLLALLTVALLPALVAALTIRLPLDWALLLTGLAVLAIALAPASERRALLMFGPLVAVVLATAAALPACRAQPTLTLIVLGGALLRGYALGWGSGWTFHPDEQALVNGTARGVFASLAQRTADLCAWLVGDERWATPWGVVLLGRAWSAALGTTLIAATYTLARLLLRPRWALLAATYVAVTPILVQHSHIASDTQLATLAALALPLAWTRLATTHTRWPIVFLAAAVGAALVLIPTTLIAVCALPVALLIRRGLTRRLPYGLITGAFVAGMGLWGSMGGSGDTSLLSGGWFAPVRAATITTASNPSIGVPPYLHSLFNVLLWGVGPLLMQLGIFGWAVGLVLSVQNTRSRPWLPLLIGMGSYFTLVGRGPEVRLDLLIPFVPLLCITAALLLQSFALRLPFTFGQRTVRLLAGTALVIALASSLGLVNVYRDVDSRIAASRWIMAHATTDSTVLHDHSIADRVPLGSGSLFSRTHLPPLGSTDRTIEAYAAAIQQADFVVLGVDRTDVNTPQIAHDDPVAACYYAALFTGRLGFQPRATFNGQPHIGSWSLDDRRADPALRVYDHPTLRVWQRVWTPSPQSIDQLLRCGY